MAITTTITTASPILLEPGDVLLLTGTDGHAGPWVVVDARLYECDVRPATRWERAWWWVRGVWRKAIRVLTLLGK